MNTQSQEVPDSFLTLRINEAKARPVWTMPDVSVVFNIAPATLEVMIRDVPMEGLFTIGRKRHIMQDAAHEWLAEVAKKYAQTVPRPYNKRDKVAV